MTLPVIAFAAGITLAAGSLYGAIRFPRYAEAFARLGVASLTLAGAGLAGLLAA